MPPLCDSGRSRAYTSEEHTTDFLLIAYIKICSDQLFWFQWDLEQKFIEFNVAKFGDGLGGNLFINIPLTNEDCVELKDSLIKWNDAFEK